MRPGLIFFGRDKDSVNWNIKFPTFLCQFIVGRDLKRVDFSYVSEWRLLNTIFPFKYRH